MLTPPSRSEYRSARCSRRRPDPGPGPRPSDAHTAILSVPGTPPPAGTHGLDEKVMSMIRALPLIVKSRVSRLKQLTVI
jgi:hypothetical protein